LWTLAESHGAKDVISNKSSGPACILVSGGDIYVYQQINFSFIKPALQSNVWLVQISQQTLLYQAVQLT
jgi:hypothetical protein